MPPRSRTAGATPEFLTSPTVGELVAIGLEQLGNPQPPAPNGDGSPEHGSPALTPFERATRSMYVRAANELRAHHESGPEES
jgi:hypothetical protein